MSVRIVCRCSEAQLESIALLCLTEWCGQALQVKAAGRMTFIGASVDFGPVGRNAVGANFDYAKGDCIARQCFRRSRAGRAVARSRRESGRGDGSRLLQLFVRNLRRGSGEWNGESFRA